MLLRTRYLFLLLAIASAAALAGAFIAQYGFNLHPCDLCLQQRVPHALVAIIGVIAFIYAHDKHRKITLITLGGLLAVGAFIALKHVGVEAGWFESSCVASGSGGSIDDIRDRIMNAPHVSCDLAMAYIFGLSMAAWNAIYSITLSAVAFYALRFK